MRGNKQSLQIDWFVLTIRWILIVSASLWLAIYANTTWTIILILIVAILGNVIAAALIIQNQSTLTLRILSLVGDLVFAHLVFYLSIPLGGELGWLGLLPLTTASLYFQWVGMILVALLNIIVQGWLVPEFVPIQNVLIWNGTLFLLYLAIGLPLIWVSYRLNKGLRLLPEWQPSNIRADRLGQDRRRAIYKLLSTLSESLNYQRVLNTCLDLSANALTELKAPADRLVSAVMLFEREEFHPPKLRVAVSRRMSLSDRRIALPGASGIVGQVIDEGKPCLTRTADKDRELSRFIAVQICRSAYCIPLHTGLDTYGIMFFAHPDIDFFTDDRREILDIVGNQSMIAIQNARLYKDLEQEKERMMEIQEEARNKMARDLHDGPTQSISAIAMRVNFARRLMERDPKAASEELFKIEDLARRTTNEIRHMLFTLRPLVLESQGLIAALESMADKMEETYNQKVFIQVDPRVVNAMEVGKQTVVFYIAEEAISNARKHAHAEHIWVRLKMLEGNLSMLEVEDDGIGFNASAVDMSYESRGSLGMVNMRERSELVNGILRVDSEVGSGTRIQVIIPLTEDAADRMRLV